MISGRTARIISGLLALAAAAVLLIANGGDDNGGGQTTVGLPTVSTPGAPTETSGLPPVDTSDQSTSGQSTPTVPSGGGEIPADERAAIGEVLKLIDAGGPFPNEQDGTVFSNREGLLPEQPQGYYHEYTVPTPGSPDRGTRRLVTGEGGEVYYTDDHYRSFTQINPDDFK
jgi:ribonuclease T1